MATPVVGITGRVDRASATPGAPLACVGESYIRAIEGAGGGALVVVPSPSLGGLLSVLDRLDGLVLSGGGDVAPSFYGEERGDLLRHVDEQRDRAELAAARWCLERGLPLLAICRGIQVLNVAAGGTLIQDIGTQVAEALVHPTLGSRPMVRIAHTVQIAEGSRLAQIYSAGSLAVNSAHHQAARAIGVDLVVTARAPDGVVEGLERPGHPFCVGVQWHPEAMVDAAPVQRRLFEVFVGAARDAHA